MKKEAVQHVHSYLPRGVNYYFERRMVRAGEHFAPHWHDFFEFEIVLQGCGEHAYNHTHYTVERGSAYLMSYYNFHELTAKTDMKLLKLQFNEHAIPKELRDYLLLRHNCLFCSFPEEAFVNMIRQFEEIEHEATSCSFLSDLRIEALLRTALIDLIRQVGTEALPATPSLGQRSAAHVHYHFREEGSLSLVAGKLAVTPNYLGALFSRFTGSSFSEYLNQVRLRYACSLLTSTNLSIKEIAFSAGYHSAEHFIYTFKFKLGSTPLQFRKAASYTKEQP